MARRFYMKVAVAFLVIAVGATLSAYESQAQGLGTLFATDGSGGNILSLNTTTGAGTDLGFLAIGGVPSVAVDPTTGSMYLGRGGGLPRLYSIDASGLGALGSIDASALVTLVGDTGLGFAAIGSLDFAPDGTLYAAVNIVGDGGTGSDHLATIDPATAATTVIGGFGTCTGVRVPSRGRGSCTLDGIEAIAFDGFGNLWGALRNRNSKGFPPPPPPGLYLIDPTTGTASFVTTIQDASGKPPGSGVVSLQFSCDGTLFGGIARGGLEGGRLVTINGVTGLFSFVGLGPATEFGRSLGGLAFQLPCDDKSRKSDKSAKSEKSEKSAKSEKTAKSSKSKKSPKSSKSGKG